MKNTSASLAVASRFEQMSFGQAARGASSFFPENRKDLGGKCCYLPVGGGHVIDAMICNEAKIAVSHPISINF